MNRSTVQLRDLDATAQALADPTRRRILTIVRDDELSAGALAAEFTHLSRPAVSQHLRVLQQAELVSVRRAGNHRMYRGRPEGLNEMRTFIDEMWNDRLTRLKRVAENADRPARQSSTKKGKRS